MLLLMRFGYGENLAFRYLAVFGTSASLDVRGYLYMV